MRGPVVTRASLLSGLAGYSRHSSGFHDSCGLIGALSSDLVCLSTTAAAARSLSTAGRLASVVGGFINLAPDTLPAKPHGRQRLVRPQRGEHGDCEIQPERLSLETFLLITIMGYEARPSSSYPSLE